MERDEYERKLRYRMCILTALESLLICYAAIKYIERDIIERWELLHYHYHSPLKFVYIFIVLKAGFILPAAFTLLSMRFKWFYRIYEALHFVSGTLMLMDYLFDVYLWDIRQIYWKIDGFYYFLFGDIWYDDAVAVCLLAVFNFRICIYLLRMLKAPSKGQM